MKFRSSSKLTFLSHKNLLFLSLLQITTLLGFEAAIDVGLRQDKLRWSIGVRNGVPNILSELNWKNVRSVNLGIAAHQMVYKNVGLRGSVHFGRIFSGSVWDRDWWGRNKTNLFSISNSRANEGSVMDAELEFCSYWPLGNGILSESVGFGYHRLELSMLGGWQNDYERGELQSQMPLLDSSYTAQFFGPFIGLGYTFPIYNWTAQFNYNYTFLQYRANGYWNLRTDFSDDFIHQSKKGFGHTFSVDSLYSFTENLKGGVLFLGRYFKAYHGDDYTFFLQDGEEVYGILDLVAARWINLSLFFYVTYQFGAQEKRPSTRERLQRVFPRL